MRIPLLSLLCLGLTCAGSRAEDPAPIRVGMELAYPPFEMVGEDGAPTGISFEIAQALGAHFKRPVKIENMSFDGLIPALKTGKIDMVISSMTANDERRKSIDFSEPYLKIGLSLLVGSKSEIQGIDDLNTAGKKVAVKRGTTGQLFASKNLPNASLLVLDKENACVLEVAQGKADAFIYDQISVFQNAQRNPDTTRAILKPFKEEVWAIGFRKGTDELRAQVNDFLKAFRESGGFERLGEKYLSTQKAAFKEQGVPFLF
jgi:polar amino acid transport system substrate-binding protein